MRVSLAFFGALIAVALSAGGALGFAGVTERVSVDSEEREGNGESYQVAVSGDGRYVVFDSNASNLVPNDTNLVTDVFVRDRLNGTSARISVSSTGEQGILPSTNAAISDDGRFVTFDSYATNLVPGDTNPFGDVFVRDLQTGSTSRVSVSSTGEQANDESYNYNPSLSGNGRYVTFNSHASNLVSGDGNDSNDVFVHDRKTKSTTRVSVDSDGREGNGASGLPAISSDGRFVAFVSDAALVSGDTNAVRDVFVHDRRSGKTTRVNVSSTGEQANAATPNYVGISAQGRWVTFGSPASNLVPGDSNGVNDVFVHDRELGITSRVSVNDSGKQGNGASGSPALSADGQRILFRSGASNLVAGDTNNAEDIFLFDRRTRSMSRESVDSGGGQANCRSHDPAISDDGRVAAFESLASNLVPDDTNGTVVTVSGCATFDAFARSLP